MDLRLLYVQFLVTNFFSKLDDVLNDQHIL